MKRFPTSVLALVLFASVAGVPARAHSSIYTFTTIDVPGSVYTFATGINDESQVVGYCEYGGFLLSGGTFRTFAMPGGIYSDAFGIDEQGRIVGQYTNPGANGFIYDGADFTTFDIPITIQGAIP